MPVICLKALVTPTAFGTRFSSWYMDPGSCLFLPTSPHSLLFHMLFPFFGEIVEWQFRAIALAILCVSKAPSLTSDASFHVNLSKNVVLLATSPHYSVCNIVL